MKQRKPFLWLVVFFAIILLILSFWIIHQNSKKLSDSLMIYDVVISTEVDDKLRLTGPVSRFQYGSRQICLRLSYSKAAKDSGIKILWFAEEKLVQSDSYMLSTPSGTKIYCLVKENGQPLPRGSYSIAIMNDTELLSDFSFEIY